MKQQVVDQLEPIMDPFSEEAWMLGISPLDEVDGIGVLYAVDTPLLSALYGIAGIVVLVDTDGDEHIMQNFHDEQPETVASFLSSAMHNQAWTVDACVRWARYDSRALDDLCWAIEHGFADSYLRFKSYLEDYNASDRVVDLAAMPRYGFDLRTYDIWSDDIAIALLSRCQFYDDLVQAGCLRRLNEGTRGTFWPRG